MSILRCDNCGDFIDTDADVESYTETEDGADQWLCHLCRDEREKEERAVMVEGRDG
jgi:hypothetical protein